MPKNHTYVLGINAYDHDVSACLLRDGEIAYAIEKERITREKHAGGFFQEPVDYCLAAEGITPIIYDQPWNRTPHPYRVVKSWEEISSLIEWD